MDGDLLVADRCDHGGTSERLCRSGRRRGTAGNFPGVSTTVLRQINIAEVVAEVEPLLGKLRTAKKSIEESQKVFSDLLKEGITDEYLAVLSMYYVDSVNMGKRAPIQDLVIWTGRNQATLKGHLREARKRQILTKVEGKAGGSSPRRR